MALVTFCDVPQELERLKAEMENAAEFQSQRDALTQKLQVSRPNRIRRQLDLYLTPGSVGSGHGAEEPGAGVAAG